MFNKLIEGIGSKIQERWLVTTLAPALLFWLGGILTAAQKYGWKRPASLPAADSADDLVLTLGCLLIVLCSVAIMRRLDLTFLRLLEGYWPSWWPWSWLRRAGVARHFRRRAALIKSLVTLERKQSQEASALFEEARARAYSFRQTVLAPGAGGVSTEAAAEAEAKYFELLQLTQEAGARRAALERLYRLTPGDEHLMPTRLGNILRAAEVQPLLRYGLDAVACYPRLWYVLPEQVREELSAARGALSDAARLCAWSLLFAGWPLYLWHLPALVWALPVGLLAAWWSYRWLCDSAEVFGDLLVAAFDTQRVKLYEALRWPLPETPAEEVTCGEEVTAFLLGVRAGRIDSTRFTAPEAPPASRKM